jgi:antitoxin PrlF
METTFLTERGTLTLPATIRKLLGIRGKQQFIVETTDKGEILLRPALVLPVELYDEDRIAEFSKDDAALGALLDRRGV